MTSGWLYCAVSVRGNSQSSKDTVPCRRGITQHSSDVCTYSMHHHLSHQVQESLLDSQSFLQALAHRSQSPPYLELANRCIYSIQKVYLKWHTHTICAMCLVLVLQLHNLVVAEHSLGIWPRLSPFSYTVPTHYATRGWLYCAVWVRWNSHPTHTAMHEEIKLREEQCHAGGISHNINSDVCMYVIYHLLLLVRWSENDHLCHQVQEAFLHR